MAEELDIDFIASPDLPFESPVTKSDLDTMFIQVGRHMRGVHSIARRCACGRPAVVRTQPRLPGGTPFPTSLYLTLPSMVEAVSRLEADGEMARLNDLLANDKELQAKYQQAHEHYLRQRQQLGEVAEIEGISAGGMPTRIKCLHALVGHALAAPGVNPIGDLVLEQLKPQADIAVCRCDGAADAAELPAPRVAAIDCGTNSIRLLIADVADGKLKDLNREMQVVRLGYGVDKTGQFDTEAVARTLAATREYAQQCREAGVEAIRFVATSATRDAQNRDEFLQGVKDILGVEVEVVSGPEEALLSFTGAVSGIKQESQYPAPYLVVDIGGGSTEFVLGYDGPDARISVDMGSVRLTERFFHHDPPLPEEVAQAKKEVKRLLDEVERQVPLEKVATFVGVAGTITTITAIELGLDKYISERVNGAVLPIKDVLATCEKMIQMPREERKQVPSMHPGRVDVIAAGCVIYSTILERVAKRSGIETVYTSEHDILDGIALALV